MDNALDVPKPTSVENLQTDEIVKLVSGQYYSQMYKVRLFQDYTSTIALGQRV